MSKRGPHVITEFDVSTSEIARSCGRCSVFGLLQHTPEYFLAEIWLPPAAWAQSKHKLLTQQCSLFRLRTVEKMQIISHEISGPVS
jgi:hypothetical protein